MTSTPYNTGEKEVLEGIIWFRVQQFLEREKEKSPRNIHLDSYPSGATTKEILCPH